MRNSTAFHCRRNSSPLFHGATPHDTLRARLAPIDRHGVGLAFPRNGVRAAPFFTIAGLRPALWTPLQSDGAQA